MVKMVNPELEVVRFENEDVIADSLRYDAVNNTWFLNGRPLNDGEVPSEVQNQNGDTVSAGDYAATNQNGYWVWDGSERVWKQ